MKARDITQVLERGVEASVRWSPSRAGEILERLSALVVRGRIDWDRGSGETWGRLLLEGEPVVALSSLVPVAFVRTPIDVEMLGILENVGVLVLPTSDWEQHEFRADADIVKQAFRLSDLSTAVDPNGFSASELWWMTV